MKKATFIGKPCKHGHTLRYEIRNRCVECERIRERLRNKVRRQNPVYIAKVKAYRDKHKEKLKLYMQVWRYGVTYEELLEKQNFKCAICKDQLKMDKKTHIDHKGDKIRGILCHLCNVGLGHFRDNKNYLQSAVEYLERNENER